MLQLPDRQQQRRLQQLLRLRQLLAGQAPRVAWVGAAAKRQRQHDAARQRVRLMPAGLMTPRSLQAVCHPVRPRRAAPAAPVEAERWPCLQLSWPQRRRRCTLAGPVLCLPGPAGLRWQRLHAGPCWLSQLLLLSRLPLTAP